MTFVMPNRKYPAHHSPIEKADRPTVIMVTTCVQHRRPILATDEIHNLLRGVWLASNHWQINRYVIMPDHIHFFCCPLNPESSFRNWQQFWRNQITRVWPNSGEKPIWQKNYWDAQIRSASEFTEKWHYVRNNPVRKGLVAHPDEWKYQGEVFPFVWLER